MLLIIHHTHTHTHTSPLSSFFTILFYNEYYYSSKFTLCINLLISIVHCNNSLIFSAIDYRYRTNIQIYKYRRNIYEDILHR